MRQISCRREITYGRWALAIYLARQLGAFMGQTKTETLKPLLDPRFDDLGAPVEVRRHPKARRLTLRVSRTRRSVVVTLPEQCDLGEANNFVHRNIDCVRERLGTLPEPVAFVPETSCRCAV